MLTGNARKQAALNLFNGLEVTMCNLAGRWADESQHENIADYRVVIQREADRILGPGAVVVGAMLRRPFGFECRLGDANYRFTITSRGVYEYRRCVMSRRENLYAASDRRVVKRDDGSLGLANCNQANEP